MIDLKDFPTAEDYMDCMQRCAAQITEAMNDIQYISKKYTTGDYFMTEEEVASYLRCDVENIPKMTWYRGYSKEGKLIHFYKRSDVNDFLESRRMGGKK